MRRFLLTMLVTAFCFSSALADNTSAPATLKVGQEITGAVAPGDSIIYSLDLGAEFFVYGQTIQHGADVIVSVTGPTGQNIGVFDVTAEGPDTFKFETEVAGTYLLAVTPFEDAAGQYSVLVQTAEPLAKTGPGRVDQLLVPYSGDNTPGVVVAVTEAGKITYDNAYGMANLSHGIPFKTSTLTNLGSTSKQFTAFAICLLAARGEISLDDDVRTYFPEFPDFGEIVTIRHLLSHTSGYREFLNGLAMGGRLLGGGDYIDRDEIAAMIERQPELQNSPGAEWNYNNSGYSLLAQIVERKTEIPFPAWMQQNVFGPLGMNDTLVRANHLDIIANSAQGYVDGEAGSYREATDISGSMGAGGIYTTVADLSLWLRNLHTGGLGGSELIEQMMTPYVLTDGEATQYGMGFFIAEQGGLVKIHHGGADAAHRAMLIYYPEIDAGVVTLSNNGSFPTSLATQIGAAFFSAHMTEEADEVEVEVATADEEFDPASYDPATFDAMVGNFEIEAFGVVMSFSREDNAYYTQIAGQPRVTLVPTDEYEFKIMEVEASISFHPGDDGVVDSMTLHQGGDHVAKRVKEEPWAPTVGELENYSGRYFSAELEAFYEVAIKEDALVLRHRRRPDQSLTPNKVDDFKAGFPIAEISFVRDADGVVTGFTAGNGRTRDVLFELTDQ